MLSATPNTKFRSAYPSPSGGVGNAKKMMRASRIPSAREVVNLSLPSLLFLSNSFSSPGSKMVILPADSRSTLFLSISTQVTILPVSAKQVPVTKPTYPVPITAIFMSIYLRNLKRFL